MMMMIMMMTVTIKTLISIKTNITIIIDQPQQSMLVNPYYTKPRSSTLFTKLGSSENPMVFL